MTVQSIVDDLGLQTVADLRRRYGPYQRDFAKRTGLTQSEVSLYERGRRNPRAETLQQIAAACEPLTAEDVREIFGRTLALVDDPYHRETAALVSLVRDFAPPDGEIRPLVIGTGVVAFATRACHVLASPAQADWWQVGSAAQDGLRALGAPRARDRWVAFAAQLGTREFCRDAGTRYTDDLEPSDWLHRVSDLTSASSGSPDVVFAHAMRDLAIVIRRYPQQLALALEEIQPRLLQQVRSHRATDLQPFLDFLDLFIEGVRVGLTRAPLTEDERDAATSLRRVRSARTLQSGRAITP